MRKQIELSFMIGYPEENMQFENSVIAEASRLCGGCTVIPAIGYWKEDGAVHKKTFKGNLASEHCFHFKLSCETDKAEMVYQILKLHISLFAHECGVHTQWVHVQQVEFVGRHFDAQKEYAGLSAVDIRDMLSPGTRGAH